MKVGSKAASSRNARAKRPSRVSIKNLDRVINDIYKDINELTINVTQLNDERDLGKGKLGMIRAVKDESSQYIIEAFTDDGWASVPLEISRGSSSYSGNKWDLSQGTAAPTVYSKFTAKEIVYYQQTGSTSYTIDDLTPAADVHKTLMVTVDDLRKSLSSLIKQLVKKRVIK